MILEEIKIGSLVMGLTPGNPFFDAVFGEVKAIVKNGSRYIIEPTVIKRKNSPILELKSGFTIDIPAARSILLKDIFSIKPVE